jgi:hypothetical protein
MPPRSSPVPKLTVARLALTVPALALMLSGCSASEEEQRSLLGSSTTLSPADFNKAPEVPPISSKTDKPADAPAATAPAAEASNSPAAAAAPGAPVLGSTIKPPAGPVSPRGNEVLPMDAMVGQVNGKPIYASTIFKAIGEDVFVRLGQETPRLEFKNKAKELIDADLKSRVVNQLLLAEAEKGLGEREQMGLAGYLVSERERLLAKYGGGVQAIAEENLKKEKGKTLDEEVESIRQRQLTQKFLQEKIFPKIHINRKDVERYFQDHIKEFQQDPSVTLRLLVAPNDKVAEQVEKDLAAGKPFDQVAKEYSVFRAEQGGLMEPYKTSLENFKGLRWDELNAQVQKLKEGQVTPRTKIDIGYAWVKLDKLELGERQELKDVFLQLENTLRAARFQQLTHKYTNDLLTNGNYTPLDQMSKSLLEVAMTRFARPQ